MKMKACVFHSTPPRIALLAVFLLLISASSVYAQADYPGFYSQSLRNTNTGMWVLGSWAVLNISSGAVGWHKGHGENQYFHQMNLMWNTVNLAIATGGLLSNHFADYSLWDGAQMLAKHQNTERLFLINAGLDVVYMAAGLGMIHFSERYPKHSNRLKGYGTSVILQGAFLMVFDLVMYFWQRSFRLDFINNLSLSLSPNPLYPSISLIF